MIDEEFDDFESVLKEMGQQDLEAMQMKLGIELAREDVEEYLGVDTNDTLKQQRIALESELRLLEKEEIILSMNPVLGKIIIHKHIN